MKPRIVLAATLALIAAPVSGESFASEESSSKELSLGIKTYKDFCSHCHGLNMVNPGTSSYDLRKWPVDNKNGFVSAVKDGKGDMPAWGDILIPKEVEALWRYVATRGGKEPFPESSAESGS